MFGMHNLRLMSQDRLNNLCDLNLGPVARIIGPYAQWIAKI